MKILFINPNIRKNIYQDLSDYYSAIDIPVWASLLANNLRNKGYDINIFDAGLDGWNKNICKIILEKHNPDLVILMAYGHHPSASTQLMNNVIMLCNDIKNYNKEIKIAIGGTHINALPELSLQQTNADFAILGTGYKAIDYIINNLYSKEKIIKSSIIQNIDEELNGYCFDLYDLKKYRGHHQHSYQDAKNSKDLNLLDIRNGYASIYTSLGCPYNCSYCCALSIFDNKKMQYWKTKTIMKWLDEIVKQDVRNIRFADELFLLDHNRVHKICDEIIERKYNLNIWVYGRVDTIEKLNLKKIKKAGINWIGIGIESANNDVRNDVNKKINKDIKKVINLLHSNDIGVGGNYIFGLPTDSLQTMQETLSLSIELNTGFVNFYCTMAYPGSMLHKIINKTNPELLPENNTGWLGYSQHSYETFPLATKYLTNKEVLKFRDEAQIIYNHSDKFLRMIENKYGSNAVNYLLNMHKVKLKRKILE